MAFPQVEGADRCGTFGTLARARAREVPIAARLLARCGATGWLPVMAGAWGRRRKIERTLRGFRASLPMEGDRLSDVERARQGDPEAFAALVQQFTPSIYRLARTMIGDAAAADAVQETFLSVWRELPRLRDASRFSPWLYRIAVNRCRSMRRDRHWIREIALVEDSPVALSSDPRDPIEARVTLARALPRLSIDQRTVIALHYGANLTIVEAASVLGVPVGTFKSRLNAALGVLRREVTS
ncbi:MAG: sigma-70 family RNA polymerase sigma factor [Gemmatimonadota bacterium]|nr:sigma-70 family RNA polymerase sigma factor [Gemmatimonadota bacterium]